MTPRSQDTPPQDPLPRKPSSAQDPSPLRVAQNGPRGPNAHNGLGHGLEPRPQFHEKTPERKKEGNLEREREKKGEILGHPPFGHTLGAPHHSGNSSPETLRQRLPPETLRRPPLATLPETPPPGDPPGDPLPPEDPQETPRRPPGDTPGGRGGVN